MIASLGWNVSTDPNINVVCGEVWQWETTCMTCSKYHWGGGTVYTGKLKCISHFHRQAKEAKTREKHKREGGGRRRENDIKVWNM